MPKMSEQVGALVPDIARQRACRIKANAVGTIIIDAQLDERLLARIRQDPMTWVIALMTLLDNLPEDQFKPRCPHGWHKELACPHCVSEQGDSNCHVA